MRKLTCPLIVVVVLAAAPVAEAQRVDFDRAVRVAAAQTALTPARNARSAQNGQAPRERRGVGKRILGGIVGGTGGFFAGGYIGAAIDGDCGGCDDPGLKGALIGMPIGAAIGAWAGQRWLF